MSGVIDWSKPVRMVGAGGQLARVLAQHNGKAFITWGSEATAHLATEHGTLPLLPHRSVENVPEPPRDHVVVCRDRSTGGLSFHKNCGETVFTEAVASAFAKEWARDFPHVAYSAVKVPL